MIVRSDETRTNTCFLQYFGNYTGDHDAYLPFRRVHSLTQWTTGLQSIMAQTNRQKCLTFIVLLHYNKVDLYLCILKQDILSYNRTTTTSPVALLFMCISLLLGGSQMAFVEYCVYNYGLIRQLGMMGVYFRREIIKSPYIISVSKMVKQQT